MEIREVKIEEYWPLIVKGTAEFGQIAAALNPEFNKLAECIYRVLNESFIQDASEYGVSRWESILGITPAAGATLDDRKAAILTYMNIKLPYTWRVLKQMLVPILGGEDKFVMEYLNDEAKLVLHTDRLNDAMLATVTSLLERVVPQNIEVVRYNHNMEISWRDWPTGYTQVEYLESSGTQGAFVMTPINKLSMLGSFSLTSWNGELYKVWGTWYQNGSIYQMIRNTETDLKIQVGSGNASRLPQSGELIAKVDYFERKAFLNGAVIFDGFTMPETSDTVRFGILCDGSMPWLDFPRFFAYARFYHLKLWDENVLTYDLVPALDPTGAPCVLDLVSRKPYYNVGTGDFLYPTDAAPAAAIGLDDKFYAQLTEHGVRRLYKVPDGSNMTKDKYAAANGFKELVEPPMPLEGYWKPEWRETDTQLILDWIETEPPMEVTENE